VTTAVASLYLNVLVLIVQSFQKIPSLTPLAPTQSEPPFLIAQAIALFAFVVLGTRAATRFRPAAISGCFSHLAKLRSPRVLANIAR